MQASKKSLTGIQVLRAVAALWVVVTHIDAIGIGSFGVDIFFVISGFVITMVGQEEAPGVFALKRLFRVVPLYWLLTLGVFCLALVTPALLKGTTRDPVELAKSLFFIPFIKSDGIAQPVLFLGWSLNYEVLFYVAFFLALLIHARRASLLVTAMILGLVVLGSIFVPATEPFRFWTSPIMLEFVFGVGLYHMWHRGLVLRFGRPVLWAGFVLLQVLIAYGGLRTGLGRQVDIGIPAALLVFWVLSGEAQAKWPAWLLMIGDASYSLYLLHPFIVLPLQRLFTHVMHGTSWQTLASPIWIGLAVGAALLSFRWIEAPTNVWLRKMFLSRDRKFLAWTKP
jgi:peptidoglycan/LPS O-acetylase OafA/YrhL